VQPGLLTRFAEDRDVHSIMHEYETEEGRRVFRIGYRLHAAFPAGSHDPGEPGSIELVTIHCTRVELGLDNYEHVERARLVHAHGGVPDSIVAFVPDDEQSRQLGRWFERELQQWPQAHAELERQCWNDARARIEDAIEKSSII
jgi:hypothetical protein